MAECEYLAGCDFFNDKLKDYAGLTAMYKRNYCLGDHTKCARYMVFKKHGKAAVPLDLLPNMVDRANSILSGS